MKEKEISIEFVPGGWVSTPRLAQKTGTWRTLRPVVDVEKCIGCGICESFCPEATIKVIDGKARGRIVVFRHPEFGFLVKVLLLTFSLLDTKQVLRLR